jgi:pyruvate dehydrogenase (quinone)
MEGLRRHQGRVSFVLVHHEEAAAFMATAHAKATGKLCVCLGTSGPGGIHLLNGLYDAKLSRIEDRYDTSKDGGSSTSCRRSLL